jgi:hypothetical protein
LEEERRGAHWLVRADFADRNAEERNEYKPVVGTLALGCGT